MQDPPIRREERPAADIVPSLDPSLLQLSDDEREFLRWAISEDEDEMMERITTVQKEAYDAFPYPCIRNFHFVSQMMAPNPVYPSVVEAGKSGETIFLDIGCHMGTDVRRLARDGYKRDHILGCDLRDTFIDLGYRLFGDTPGTNPIRFFTADIFEVSVPPASSQEHEVSDPRLDETAPIPERAPAVARETSLATVESLSALRGRVNHIYAGALFHLFDEDTQMAIALRMAVLLRRAPGAVVFGRHQGKEEEGLMADHMSRVRYGHSPTSWRAMWLKALARLESDEWAAEHVRVDANIQKPTWSLPEKSERVIQQLTWAVRIV